MDNNLTTCKKQIGVSKHLSIRETYDALDGLRSIACIGIVLMHVLSNIKIKPTDDWFYSNVISFAGDFVLLFMMVSAFSLSCGYYERFRDGNISLDQFYKKRYTRILPFFALLIGIDIVQTFLINGIGDSAVVKSELCESFANLTLAFGLMPDANISVIGVGWFLGVIFLFYMIYPFYVFLIGNKKRAGWVLLISIVWFFVGSFYFSEVKNTSWGSSSILKCSPYFIIGGLIYLYRNKIVQIKCGILIPLLTIAYTLFFFYFPSLRIPLLSNGVLYAVWLIYAVYVSSIKSKSFLNNKVMKFLSGISMEVYLCHMMFFRVFEKLHLEQYITNLDALYWITCSAVLMSSVGFALLWKRIEMRFGR